MPPKADPKTKPNDPRSKSADSRWNVVGKNLTSAVSKSLPTMNRKGAVNGSVTKSNAPSNTTTVNTEKKKRRRKKRPEEQFVQPEPPKPRIVITKEDKRNKTLWRHIIWLIVLFAYSLLGGLIFSAIEGGYDRSFLVVEYEKNMDIFKRRRHYQEQLFRRFRDIDSDKSISNNRRGATLENYKLQLARHALAWYESKLGVIVEEPMMMESKWTLWGGVYYAASLYTTIGYGNFFPRTTSGRIMSMLYAFFGIPLVFTILCEWGFLYFTWIEYGWNWVNEKFCQKSLQRQVEKRYMRERIRRVGSELSLHSMSTVPLLSVHRTTSNMVNTTDHQIESNKPLGELDVVLPEEEQAETVPMKAALIFFFLWISLSAFIVRLWEYEWSYFSAFYFFFTSLTTIGLGDVVTKTPNFIIFNLALTLVGLSVVGLCLAIVQAKVRLVFDRLIRSIDSQYRIRQIDPDVATMTLIPDEKEGIKRLIGAQPLQDRIVFIFMDEHKKCMLRDRWKLRSGMVNRITQTYPSRADKYVQTGNRVYDQPGQIGSAEEDDEDWDEEDESDEDEDDVEYDEAGNRIVPPSTKRYIYTVFD
uniref:Ion channel n=1 Tax=Haemonchus contortus TaxID=6289 RepID=A0A7I4Z033_HAECO|nr:Ion transport 2 domain containing protein [Haemonchus contortus]